MKVKYEYESIPNERTRKYLNESIPNITKMNNKGKTIILRGIFIRKFQKVRIIISLSFMVHYSVLFNYITLFPTKKSIISGEAGT